jgi:hypothetical protein
MFNILNKTMTTTLDEASTAAEKILESVTPDNSIALIEACEYLGLGITAEITSKAQAMADADDGPNV